MFRYGGLLHLGTLLGTKAAEITIWVILAHFCWARNYLQLSFEFFENLAVLADFTVSAECLADFADFVDFADFSDCL